MARDPFERRTHLRVDPLLQLLQLFLRQLQDLVQQATPAGTAPRSGGGRRCRWMRELLHALLRQLAHVAQRLAAAVHTAQQILQRLAALLDDPAQRRQAKQAVLALLLLEDDLREGDGGEIFAAVVVDDAQVVAGAHQLRDAVERHVAARVRIVHFAVAVAFDEPGHGVRSF